MGTFHAADACQGRSACLLSLGGLWMHQAAQMGTPRHTRRAVPAMGAADDLPDRRAAAILVGPSLRLGVMTHLSPRETLGDCPRARGHPLHFDMSPHLIAQGHDPQNNSSNI